MDFRHRLFVAIAGTALIALAVAAGCFLSWVVQSVSGPHSHSAATDEEAAAAGLLLLND